MKQRLFSVFCLALSLLLLAGCSLFEEPLPTGAVPSDTPDTPTYTAATEPPTEPVTEPITEPTDTAESAVIIPALVGLDMSVVQDMFLPLTEVTFQYVAYPAPEGTIVDASFAGIRTETEYHIDPHSPLLLTVSTGTSREDVKVPEGDRTMYLTFDDGPIAENTIAILDVLDQYDIKATFFVLGYNVNKNPDLLREIAARGHVIACHSYSHDYDYIYESAENMQADLEKWEATVEKVLGYVPEEKIFRCPGGSSLAKNEEVLDYLCKKGYRIFDWNAVNDDCMLHTRGEGVTPEEFIKDRVVSSTDYSLKMKTVPHIMLMHDTYRETPALLPWMIDYLTDLGCTFDTLDKLPGSWTHG